MRKIGEFQNIKDHRQPDRQQAQLRRPYQRIYENLCNLHLFILQVVDHHQNPQNMTPSTIKTPVGSSILLLNSIHIEMGCLNWVFQTGCFAPGFTALFSTIGALRAPVFHRLWR
jgi:hypothetical protein